MTYGFPSSGFSLKLGVLIGDARMEPGFYPGLRHAPESFRGCSVETWILNGRVPLPVTWVQPG